MVANEPLISMADAAALLNVPKETFKRWRKHGKGPLGYPLGREVKFRPSEVEAWLQQQREQAPEPSRHLRVTRAVNSGPAAHRSGEQPVRATRSRQRRPA